MGSVPTLSQLSTRLTAVDGVGAAVPSSADIPTINADLNALHNTIQQWALVVQAEINAFAADLAQLQTAVAGEANEQAVRMGTVLVTAGTLSVPYSLAFPTPFADGLYTTEVTVSIAEPLSTASCVVAGVQQQSTPGNGVIVWIVNNDSINHNATINVFARHD
ncbi:MAG: hypothetical protein WA766_11810 [Candidatus Acidiferrales bacterium]